MLSWVQSMWETHASQNIYGASCSDSAFNVVVDTLPLQIGVRVSIVVSFTFSDSCNFIFSMLLRSFLSKEPSEILDSSTTFDFLVSVRISDFLFIVGLFECFCG